MWAPPLGKYQENFRPKISTNTHRTGHRIGHRINGMGKLRPIRHIIPIVPESGTKVADFRANSNYAAITTRIDGKAEAQVRLLDPGQC